MCLSIVTIDFPQASKQEKILFSKETLPTVPFDTGHYLKVYKAFLKHSGHVFNVLCTFNLHPVSRGFDCSFLKPLL